MSFHSFNCMTRRQGIRTPDSVINTWLEEKLTFPLFLEGNNQIHSFYWIMNKPLSFPSLMRPICFLSRRSEVMLCECWGNQTLNVSCALGLWCLSSLGALMPCPCCVAPRLQHIQLRASPDHVCVCVVFILAGAKYSFILLGLRARPDGMSYKTQ